MLAFYVILYSLASKDGETMIYGNMPMMIFILAAGYLFSVYLLLALAKRALRKDIPQSTSSSVNEKRGLTANVNEVLNSQ